MQLPLPFRTTGPPPASVLVAGRRTYIVRYVRVARARHYILRLEDDGHLRVTIPRGGSRGEAERFVRARAGWLERQRYRQALGSRPGPWTTGTVVLLRGEECTLGGVEENGLAHVLLGRERISHPGPLPDDLRPLVQRHLRAMAARELPDRVSELAACHGFTPGRVSIRNQRSRWGSCSRSGRISLNWRLVQMPPDVRDYVLLHELVHLVHLDHSPRFWRELNRVCPWHAEARRWIKRVDLMDGRR